MPKRTTSNGPRQMDCSDGAKMLIDQMKQHPEEFRGYGGKFANLLDAARDAVQGTLRNTWISQRDATAILAAAETHLYEVWLAEDVLTRIMPPKQEEANLTARPQSPRAGLGTLTGTTISNALYTTGSSNTAFNTISSNSVSSPTFAESFQREMERYKQEEFKRREYEHAMRNTKPLKDFL